MASTLVKSVLACAVALVAGFAAPVAHAGTMPAAGTRELRVGATPVSFEVIGGGSGFSFLRPDKGENLTATSLGVGMGWFATDHVALGGTVGFYSLVFDGGSDYEVGPSLSGFLRLYQRSGRAGFFVEPTVELQYLRGDAGLSSKLLGIGADLGVEVFLVDSWALRLGPTFRHYKEWGASVLRGADTGSVTNFGLNWGIAAYF
jgi:hypothetical protein